MVVPNGGVQCRGPSGASLSSWRGPSNAIDQATGQGHHSLPFSPWVTEMTTLTRWVLLWLWRVRKLRHHILLLSLSEEFPSRSCEMRLLHLWPSGSSPLSFLPTRSHADICVPWLCEWCRTLIWSWINQLLMSNSCRKNTFPFSFFLLARFFCWRPTNQWLLNTFLHHHNVYVSLCSMWDLSLDEAIFFYPPLPAPMKWWRYHHKTFTLFLSPWSKHCISVIYYLIHNINPGSLGQVRGAWEGDLDLSCLMNTGDTFLTSFIHHQYVQNKAWYNVRFYIGFTILILNVLKYTPLTTMHVIGAGIHQWISFICCGNVLNYLSFWIKIFKTLKETFDIDFEPNPLLAYWSVMVQKALAFTILLVRHLILLKWKHVAPPSFDMWLKEVFACIKVEKKID